MSDTRKDTTKRLAGHPDPPFARKRPEADANSEDEDDFDSTYGGQPLPTPHEGHDDGLKEADGCEEATKRERVKKPYFFPPLWLQRRTAIAELLKAERVKTLADLGCGHGALLSLLALPAYHADDFPLPPSSYSASNPTVTPPSSARTREEKLALFAALSSSDVKAEKELHLTRLIGIDHDRSACRAATEACRPRERPLYMYSHGEEGENQEEGGERVDNDTRWEELSVEVWQGGVEAYNETLVGVDAIVLTEVIEHLTPAALSRLPHLLFNVYRPRLIILTTPNHSFNAYFPPPTPSSSSANTSHPASPSSDEHDCEEKEEGDAGHRFLDPSGRTNRIFRDPTHLFEFTAPEFRDWVESSLATSTKQGAYEVELTGVGSLSSYYSTVSRSYSTPEIPFPPPGLESHPALKDDPALRKAIDGKEEGKRFWATQIAVLRRRDGEGEKAGEWSGASKQKGHGGASSQAKAGRATEEDERSPRSPRPIPLPFYTGSRSSPPFPSPNLPSSSSYSPPPSAPIPTLQPHRLTSSFTLPAHSCASLPPVPPVQLLTALTELFTRARAPVLSLADVWRLGTESFSASASASGRECVRGLARGRVGAVVDALCSEEAEAEWELEIDGEGAKEGEKTKVMMGKTAMNRVKVRWTVYVEPPKTDKEEEDEEGGRWGDTEEEGVEEEEEEEHESLPLPLPPSSSASGPLWRKTEAGEGRRCREKGGADEDEEEGGSEEGYESKSAPSAKGIGGWADDPW
ncbi:hypothetical protein JCM11251_002310 [Rhodosporidiobolus azoricus]